MEIIPFLFAIIFVLSLFGTANGSQINPMICLPSAPLSTWRLPNDPICPSSHWKPNDMPFELTILGVNYKTLMTICKCIKLVIKQKRCFWGGYYEIIEAIPIEVHTSICTRMANLNHFPACELVKNSSLRSTMGWSFWPVALLRQKYGVDNFYIYDLGIYLKKRGIKYLGYLCCAKRWRNGKALPYGPSEIAPD
jgi:hypothetical protein